MASTILPMRTGLSETCRATAPKTWRRITTMPRELRRAAWIRLKTVLSRTGLSQSTIYRKIVEGTFPAQLKISANGTGWHESDINRWFADPVSWRPRCEFGER